MKLADAVTVHNGKEPKARAGEVPVFAIGGQQGFTDRSITDVPVIAIGIQGTVGKPRIFTPPVWLTSTQKFLEPVHCDLWYLLAVLENLPWDYFTVDGSVLKSLSERFWDIELKHSHREQKHIGQYYRQLCQEYEKEKEIVRRLKETKNQMLNKCFPQG